jgi:spore coat protein U-like protein
MKSLIYTVALSAAAFVTVPAMAQQAVGTANFDVTLSVLPACTIDVDNLVLDANGEGSTDLTVNCNADLTLQVGLSGTGQLSGPRGTVPYGLYQDAGYTDVWGNDAADQVDFVITDGSATETIYAQTTQTGDLPVGEFSDTVTATLWYTAE